LLRTLHNGVIRFQTTWHLKLAGCSIAIPKVQATKVRIETERLDNFAAACYKVMCKLWLNWLAIIALITS
jgi:hypothetical protein